MSKESLSVEPR